MMLTTKHTEVSSMSTKAALEHKKFFIEQLVQTYSMSMGILDNFSRSLLQNLFILNGAAIGLTITIMGKMVSNASHGKHTYIHFVIPIIIFCFGILAAVFSAAFVLKRLQIISAKKREEIAEIKAMNTSEEALLKTIECLIRDPLEYKDPRMDPPLSKSVDYFRRWAQIYTIASIMCFVIGTVVATWAILQ